MAIFGPLLDDRLKENLKKKSWNPERMSFVFTFVSVRVTEHTFWPRNLIFWTEGPLGHEKKNYFCFSKFRKMTFVGSFLLLFYPFLYHYLCCHIIGITVFGLFDWYLLLLLLIEPAVPGLSPFDSMTCNGMCMCFWVGCVYRKVYCVCQATGEGVEL